MEYEIRRSQYDDPDKKSGQHTNGPANIFVREDDSCPWYFVDGVHSLHKVNSMVKSMGLQEFQTKHCVKVMD